MTLAMAAFQVSISSAGAIHCRKGAASGSTSGGALSSRISGSAPPSAIAAQKPPTQLLAPNAARATASAWSRRPAPSACDTTTEIPAPTMRSRMKSMAATWCASANPAAAASDSRAASAVPTRPTAMPRPSSRKSGKATGASRGFTAA